MAGTDAPGILAEPTVLVLGAGASHPYGFPLGSDLKREILNYLRGLPDNHFTTHGFPPELLREFREVLQYGSHSTIDVFLERKSNLRGLGSYLIASTIMPVEQHDRLFPEHNWYADVYHALQFESDEPDTGNLAIVTLNYERSLEHFLAKNMVYNCLHNRVEFADEKRRRIGIIHAHGSFGAYPDVPYGTGVKDLAALKNAANNIRIISDRMDDSKDFHEAQQTIAKARHIVFIGFGYHERTLTGLLATSGLGEKKVYGTGIGVDDAQRTRIRAAFDDKITLGDPDQATSAFLAAIGLTKARGT